jgi:hypothetical protein
MVQGMVQAMVVVETSSFNSSAGKLQGMVLAMVVTEISSFISSVAMLLGMVQAILFGTDCTLMQ